MQAILDIFWCKDSATSAGTPSGASITGHLIVAANRGLDPLRVVLFGPHGFVRELPIRAGSYAAHGLPPGPYRLELHAPRIILARRTTLGDTTHTTLDLTIR